VGKAQAQVKPIKFKCHACAEQMHADTLLQVPGDGTNELRVGIDWERRGLEPGLGDVLRRELDEYHTQGLIQHTKNLPGMVQSNTLFFLAEICCVITTSLWSCGGSAVVSYIHLRLV